MYKQRTTCQVRYSLYKQHTSSNIDFLVELIILALTSMSSSLTQDQAASHLILLAASKLKPAQVISAVFLSCGVGVVKPWQPQ